MSLSTISYCCNNLSYYICIHHLLIVIIFTNAMFFIFFIFYQLLHLTNWHFSVVFQRFIFIIVFLSFFIFSSFYIFFSFSSFFSFWVALVMKQWKISYIIAVFKRGNRKNPTDYRPIAETSGFCRLLEIIMHTKTTTYLIENSLLSNCQYGFLPKRSSCSQLLSCIHDWI